MEERKDMQNEEKLQREKDLFKRYLQVDTIVLILSISIPLILIMINQYLFTCGHHNFNKLQGGAWGWIIGRSLGFTCLIWFVFTMYRGFNTKKNAKMFKNMKMAKNLHCRTATTLLIIFFLHVIILVTTEPWRSILLRGRVRHLPLSLYMLKFWTGVIFGVIMVISILLFIYLKDLQRLKKFGYKRFILVHRIMLLCLVLLVIHIVLINTEFWLAFMAQNIHD